jgi:hypothetical protein
MFSDWVGVDGTSIWAAATSGLSAISVHLLACMIARMFTGSESTSIWHELVEKRKDQLLKSIDGVSADDSERVAANCEICSYLVDRMGCERPCMATDCGSNNERSTSSVPYCTRGVEA